MSAAPLARIDGKEMSLIADAEHPARQGSRSKGHAGDDARQSLQGDSHCEPAPIGPNRNRGRSRAVGRDCRGTAATSRRRHEPSSTTRRLATPVRFQARASTRLVFSVASLICRCRSPAPKRHSRDRSHSAGPPCWVSPPGIGSRTGGHRCGSRCRRSMLADVPANGRLHRAGRSRRRSKAACRSRRTA